jgi:hypothetical protein
VWKSFVDLEEGQNLYQKILFGDRRLITKKFCLPQQCAVKCASSNKVKLLQIVGQK